jgi:hypothetical protein
MTPSNPESFFGAVLSAGAILSGFCGTFLSFRLQREATYYRQPVVAIQGNSNDVFIGRTHFTSALFLLILATACTVVCGVVLPLLALDGCAWAASHTGLIVGGIIAGLVLIAGYFLDELVHYDILKWSRFGDDMRDWKKEWWIVVLAALFASLSLLYFARE